MRKQPNEKRRHGQGGFRTRNGTEYFVFRPAGAKNQKWIPIGKAGELGVKAKEAKAAEIRSTYTVPEPGESVTYKEAADKLIVYLRDVKGRSPATLEQYESGLRCHFTDWHNRDVWSITRGEVEAKQEKLRKTLEPKSVNNYMGNAKAVLNFAVKKGWLDESPGEHVETLSVPDKGKLKFLTAADLEKLCKAVPKDRLGFMEEIMYRVTFETGMRMGEVLALRWCDLDYTAEKITVERSNSGRTEEGDGPTKNKKSRTIPMTRKLRDLFEELFRISEYRSLEDRVFCHPETGKLYDRSKMRKRYAKALLKGKVGPTEDKRNKAGKLYTKPVLTFHSLRHSYGTALAMGGAKPIQIKELMGHSSLRMTEKYMHFAPDVDEAERVGAIFEALRAGV